MEKVQGLQIQIDYSISENKEYSEIERDKGKRLCGLKF